MKDKKYLFMAVGGYLLLVAILTTLLGVFREKHEFFFNLSTAIIISWIVSLIVYYIWAIYFYNINMGWDDDDWERVSKLKDEQSINQLDDEPMKNPHEGETLGLPPGTVRGTIALSLLVTGLALVIASFQMNRTYDSNSLFVDNFEFFKTAFLMMIAFYFGNKSLEAISNRNQGIYRPDPTLQGASPTSHNKRKSNSSNAPASPVIPRLHSGQGSVLKKTLQTESTETEEDVNPSDFEDKESVG